MGLAGLLYVDDPADPPDLPSTYAVDDIPLVIQDRRFAADGRHPYSDGGSPSMHDQMAGLKGESMLVNGTIEPQFSVRHGLIRFRILNGSNARNYNLGFSDNRTFQHIGGDGGLFEKPLAATRVLLGPAERAEILVDFGSDGVGDELVLRSYSEEVVDRMFSGPMAGNFADNLDRATFSIMSFRVCEALPTPVVPPSSFDPIERLSESDAARTRSIAMSMAQGAFLINGEQMTQLGDVPDALNYRIPAGDVELWVVTNTSGMAHPLHVHNRHFQVLDINGQPPPPYLAGWKDTVLVEPGQTYRLLLEFVGIPDEHFPYMFHCHILEHEDQGMMGQFYIVDPEAAAPDARG